jgi:tRNA pseudouridine32 synthase / 23S rRNA pseudouridine746 synthase
MGLGVPPRIGAGHSVLPTRDGVGASCVALPEGPWVSMLEFLAQRFPRQGRSLWARRMQDGEVVDEHGQPVAVDRPYQARLRLYYYRSLEAEPRIPFDEVVLHQDAHLVVVDKPHFLPVVPSGPYLQETVLVRLKQKLGIDALVPLHRIDRDTAGLVLFSVQPRSRGVYSALFREHHMRKTYEAIAPWRDDLTLPLTRASRIGESAHFMQQCEVQGPPNTRTHLRLLERAGEWARYELEPVTGHRHQLRVHMNALGLPILHDGIYPKLTPEGHTDYARPLQLLARSISFTDPLTGRPCSFESQRRLDLSRAGLSVRAPDRSPP